MGISVVGMDFIYSLENVSEAIKLFFKELKVLNLDIESLLVRMVLLFKK